MSSCEPWLVRGSGVTVRIVAGLATERCVFVRRLPAEALRSMARWLIESLDVGGTEACAPGLWARDPGGSSSWSPSIPGGSMLVNCRPGHIHSDLHWILAVL